MQFISEYLEVVRINKSIKKFLPRHLNFIVTENYEKLCQCLNVKFNEKFYSSKELQEKYNSKTKQSEKSNKKILCNFSKESKEIINFIIAIVIGELEMIWELLEQFEKKEDITKFFTKNYSEIINKAGINYSLFYSILISNSNQKINSVNSSNLKDLLRSVMNEFCKNIYLTEYFSYHVSLFFTRLLKNISKRVLFEKIKTLNLNIFKTEILVLLDNHENSVSLNLKHISDYINKYCAGSKNSSKKKTKLPSEENSIKNNTDECLESEPVEPEIEEFEIEEPEIEEPEIKEPEPVEPKPEELEIEEPEPKKVKGKKKKSKTPKTKNKKSKKKDR